MYINDIVNTTPNGDFVLYADDTNIFVAGNSKEAAYEKANEVLNYVYKYMVSNKLHINMTKCCYMHFKPTIFNAEIQTEHSEEHKLMIDGIPLKIKKIH